MFYDIKCYVNTYFLQIWVVFRFISDACGVTMSWVYDCVGRQGEQSLLYGTDELRVVAVGKVGTPNGTLE